MKSGTENTFRGDEEGVKRVEGWSLESIFFDWGGSPVINFDTINFAYSLI